MSHLQQVKNYYQAFNDKNWEGMLALLHPDVRHEINQGDVQIGVEKFEKFLKHMDECYDERLADLVFMSDETGSRFAVEFVVHGIYKKQDGSDLPPAFGQSYVLPAGAFLEIREDLIWRVATFYNLPEWIRLVKTPSGK